MPKRSPTTRRGRARNTPPKMQTPSLNLGDLMSDTQKPTATPTGEATAETPVIHEGVVVEKQPNFIVRGFRKIKNTPPKTAIAVVGGVALVAAGAVLGRSTAPYHVAIVEDEFSPEPLLEVPAADESDQSA